MIYLLFIVAFLASVILNFWQRYIEYFPAQRTKTFQPAPSFIRKTIWKNFFRSAKPGEGDKAAAVKISLISGFKKFFITFSIVALFYSILKWWMESHAYSDLSQATILAIERRIHIINDTFKPFEQITFLPEILLITLLIALASSWPVIERLKLKKRYESLMKAAGFILGLFTIAASFTFFGSELRKGEKEVVGNLRAHEFKIIKDNKFLVEQVEQKVKEEVVKQLLENNTVGKFMAEDEAVSRAVDSLINSPDFTFRVNYFLPDDPAVAQLLSTVKPVDNIENSVRKYENDFVKRNTNFIQEHAEVDFNSLSRQSTYEAADFYKAISEQKYKEYLAGNIINESALSEKNVQHAIELVSEATGNFLPPASNKYGEVAVKIFDNSYSLTIKGWFNEALSGLINIPLLGDILEPLHDISKDYLKEKVKKVLAAVYSGKKEATVNELGNIRSEIDPLVKAASNKNMLVEHFEQKFKLTREKILQCGNLAKERNKIVMQNADRNLAAMKGKSRWQRIRDAFAKKSATQSISDNPAEPFTKMQWEEFDATLNKWNNYIEQRKFTWMINGEKDIEPFFYEYIKSNPTACAAWGFILQQNDWDEAADYFTFIEPDVPATGKPYFLLKYYCGTTKYGDVDDLYTKEVDREGVGKFCKPRKEN